VHMRGESEKDDRLDHYTSGDLLKV